MHSIGTDLDPEGRRGVLVSGVENLVGAVLRRLQCPRGYLPHQPHYGSLLTRYLGEPFDVAMALVVRAEVARTILEDERVIRVVSLSVEGTDTLDAFFVRASVECIYGVVDIAGPIVRETT